MYQRPYFMDFNYKSAFLANMADRLSEVICQQTQILNHQSGSITPVKSVSTMLYLLENGPTTLMKLASALGFSHQLTSQRMAPLEKLGLLKRTLNPNDKRQKLIELTKLGQQDAKILQNNSYTVADAIEKKFISNDLNLMHAIEEMISSIDQNPLFK